MSCGRSILIIAHRGASAVAPESTRVAICEAVRLRAQMVELDVQMTLDGRLVVFHDDRLERTTNGTGMVTRKRYAELASLDAGSWFHRRFAGERILLLSQAIRLVPPPLGINLELKHTSKPRTFLARFLRIIRRTRMRSRLLVSSFDPDLLRPLRSQQVALALICQRDPDRSLTRAIQFGCRAWHPAHEFATPGRIARAHTAGLRVHAWTVETHAQAWRLVRWGVDGMFTNHPGHLRGFIHDDL